MAVSDIILKDNLVLKGLVAEADLANAQAEATKQQLSLGQILLTRGLVTQEELDSLTEKTPSPTQVADNSAAQSVEKTIRTILEYGVRSGATDIHIEPRGKFSQVRYRIDGMLVSNMKLSGAIHTGIVSYLKQLAQIFHPEDRLPQSGQFKGNFGKIIVEFRVSTLPTTMGEKVVVRIIEQLPTSIELGDLGMHEADIKMIRDILKIGRGVVITTGAILSDSTSVLYALLHEFDTNANNIMTIENPVLQNIAGINQTEIDLAHRINFPTAISGALKQDPTTLMISDLNNVTSAELVFDAALNGRLMMGGLNAQNSIFAIIRLNDMQIAPFLIASVLRLIIATRRVRRLCSVCRRSYIPTSEELQTIKQHLGDWQPRPGQSSTAPIDHNRAQSVHGKKVIPAPSRAELARHTILDRIATDPNIIYRGIAQTKPNQALAEETISPPPKSEEANQNATFYQAVGCQSCNNTGYLGQLNLFEILPVNDELASAIAAGKTESELRQVAMKSGFVPLAQDGLEKAGQGLTTIAEVLRVL